MFGLAVVTFYGHQQVCHRLLYRTAGGRGTALAKLAGGTSVFCKAGTSSARVAYTGSCSKEKTRVITQYSQLT